MKLNLLILCFIALSFGSALAATPEALSALWAVPTSEVKAFTSKSYILKKIKIEEVYYQSRPYNGKPVRIFGYFCYPLNSKKPLPALLIVHGGGGTASQKRASRWARHGYATFAIDLPGKGERRRSSRSTGPNMDVPTLLRGNYLVHAVAATRNAITYLSQRKEVDPQRIGMIGLSWGGVITLLTNGQDDRLKAAVDVFGAGYIPEGCTWQVYFNSFSAEEMRRWYAFLDPKNFLLTQHAPILFVTGTNDHCYYLPTFQKSYEEVSATKSFWLIPNLRHRFMPYAEATCLAWFEKKLKGKGGFEGLTVLPLYLSSKSGEIIIATKAQATDELAKVTLFFTPGGPQQWTHKIWKALLPVYKDYQKGLFYFSVSPNLIRPEMIFFVSGQDIYRGCFSSLAQSLFRVELPDHRITYAASAPIRTLYRHEPPVTLLDGTDSRKMIFVLSKKENIYKALSRDQ